MSSGRVRIGTRASRLALWQANHVASRLAPVLHGRRLEIVTFDTTGDRIADAPLPALGDRGLFTKDIETALADGAIDLAVHSLKDLPTAIPDGLALGAVLEREDPSDVLVSASGAPLRALPGGARVGSSSLRRRAQLLALRRDLVVSDIRGNVPTRVEKVTRGDYDATLLARAGLERLGMSAVAAEVFEPSEFLPAPGQAALAVEIRADDRALAEAVGALDHTPTRLATCAERAVLASLRGGCQAPLGTLGRWEAGRLHLTAVVGAVSGERLIRAAGDRPVSDEQGAADLGERIAGELRRQGAPDILAEARAWLESMAPAGGTA